MVYTGDALTILKTLDDESVQCVVTSPPYFGLRSYDGGHLEIGKERTPEEYVTNLVQVFHEVRRVLHPTGTCFINLGDSYGAGKVGRGDSGGGGRFGGPRMEPKQRKGQAKQLLGIPWAVARALQAPYYTGRVKDERDRVWLAAMVDGEGTICGFDHDRIDDGSHRSGVHITITNSSTALLDEAARIWPASRSEHDHPGEGHLGTRDTYRWIVHGIENKLAVLREIYPHLIVKKQQATVAYSLLLLMADAKRLGHSPQKDATLAKRKVLTGLLSDLNHLRPVTLPDWLTGPPTLFEPGWYLRQDIIWSKPNPMPESVTDRCTKSHEYIFLLTKSPRYYFDADAIAEPITDSSAIRLLQNIEAQTGSTRVPGKTNGTMKAVGKKPWYPTMGGGGTSWKGHSGYRKADGTLMVKPTRNKRDVWTVTTKPFKGAHFAVMPEALVEPCILAGTKPGDIALDPFCGSGTVGIVCKRLGRSFIGIDLNPAYVAMAEKRITNTPQPMI